MKVLDKSADLFCVREATKGHLEQRKERERERYWKWSATGRSGSLGEKERERGGKLVSLGSKQVVRVHKLK